MSNPSAKPGAAHTVDAVVEDEGITDPEEEDDESSDESRRSVSQPPQSYEKIGLYNSTFSRASTIP
jgi:hypothetical protein